MSRLTNTLILTQILVQLHLQEHTAAVCVHLEVHLHLHLARQEEPGPTWKHISAFTVPSPS